MYYLCSLRLSFLFLRWLYGNWNSPSFSSSPSLLFVAYDLDVLFYPIHVLLFRTVHGNLLGSIMLRLGLI
jgi:hypothetical protein